MKRCYICNEELPLDTFHKDVSRKDGLSNRCRECHVVYMRKYKKGRTQKTKEDRKIYYDANCEKLRQYYQDNKEWILHNAKQKRTGKNGYLKTMLQAAKYRAKKKGWEFNLDLNYLHAIAPERCPVDGREFDWERRLENDSTLLLTIPSLDRIDSTKGYIKGNIAIIGDQWNRWKSNMNLDDLHKLIEYVRGAT